MMGDGRLPGCDVLDLLGWRRRLRCFVLKGWRNRSARSRCSAISISPYGWRSSCRAWRERRRQVDAHAYPVGPLPARRGSALARRQADCLSHPRRSGTARRRADPPGNPACRCPTVAQSPSWAANAPGLPVDDRQMRRITAAKLDELGCHASPDARARPADRRSRAGPGRPGPARTSPRGDLR